MSGTDGSRLQCISARGSRLQCLSAHGSRLLMAASFSASQLELHINHIGKHPHVQECGRVACWRVYIGMHSHVTRCVAGCIVSIYARNPTSRDVLRVACWRVYRYASQRSRDVWRVAYLSRHMQASHMSRWGTVWSSAIRNPKVMYFAKGLFRRDQDSRPTASACLGMDYIHRYDHFYVSTMVW